MVGSAVALVALGVLFVFLPGNHVIRLISGISAIVCAGVVLALAFDMRRRYGRDSGA